MAAFFSLVGCAVGAFSCIFDFAPFVLLKGAPYLTVFSPEQLQGLAYMFLAVRAQANDIGLVFFGLHCLGVGYLILRSTFLPRTIGALMVVAGLGWLTFLSPPLANSLAPFNMLPGAVGELSLTLWLLVKGVNVQRWNAQAARRFLVIGIRTPSPESLIYYENTPAIPGRYFHHDSRFGSRATRSARSRLQPLLQR